MARPRTLVCFGDSLTAGVVSASYVERLRRLLPNMQIINAGVNGDTVRHLLQRLERDVVNHNPDVVLILVGLNDIGTAYGAWPLRGYYRLVKGLGRAIPLRRYAMLYRQLIRALQTRTNAELILCTPTTITEDLSDPIQPVIDAYSNVVRTIAMQEQLRLVDVRKAFIEELRSGAGTNKSYTIWLPMFDSLRRRWSDATYTTIAQQRNYRLLCDGVHLSEAGADVLAQALQPALEQALCYDDSNL